MYRCPRNALSGVLPGGCWHWGCWHRRRQASSPAPFPAVTGIRAGICGVSSGSGDSMIAAPGSRAELMRPDVTGVAVAVDTDGAAGGGRGWFAPACRQIPKLTARPNWKRDRRRARRCGGPGCVTLHWQRQARQSDLRRFTTPGTRSRSRPPRRPRYVQEARHRSDDGLVRSARRY